MQEPFPDLPTLGHLIGAARRRIKQALWLQLQPLGLTPQQFWVLLVVDQHGSLSLHELADQVWMDDPTASRVVKALVERRLLLSLADPAHGRRRAIQLGPEGQRLQPQLRTLARTFREHIEGGINPRAEAQLRQGLERVIANMESLKDRHLLADSSSP
jgi:DNA-binding MarR family transcriptional regulator